MLPCVAIFVESITEFIKIFEKKLVLPLNL
jgi:hypothetical protein